MSLRDYIHKLFKKPESNHCRDEKTRVMNSSAPLILLKEIQRLRSPVVVVLLCVALAKAGTGTLRITPHTCHSSQLMPRSAIDHSHWQVRICLVERGSGSPGLESSSLVQNL
jgi:hypothetical protein